MKKVLLILLLLLSININAKEITNDLFSININDEYKEEINDGKIYKWSKDNNYLLLTIENNTNKYNIKDFNEDDINSQKEYIINSYKEKTSDNIIVNNINILNKESLYYIEYNIKIESKNTIGHDIYQIGRTYTTDNYIYNIIYNSDSKIEDTTMMDSLIIKDTYLKRINISLYAILSIIILGLILLFDYLLHKKKH